MGLVYSRLTASRRKQATTEWRSKGAMPLTAANASSLSSGWSVHTPQLSVVPSAQLGKSGLPVPASLLEGYGNSSLSFEANEGQSDPRVKFLSRGIGYTLFLTSNESVMALRRPTVDSGQPSTERGAEAETGFSKSHATIRNSDPTTHNPDLDLNTSSYAEMRMRFVVTHPEPRAAPSDQLTATVNYLVGHA